MLKSIIQIPITQESYPFATAEFQCKLSEKGYTEDEYLMSGTANIYEEGSDYNPVIIYEEAPYTTRLLVRRPADVSKFSGNVIVEVLNASAMMDIDRMWVNSWQYFVRNGDIYIGITSKGHVVDSLLRFDENRYKDMNWSNPSPDRIKSGVHKSPFPFLPQFESGLFWDMLSDLGTILKSDQPMNPIVEYGDIYLYLTGWSQSGSYLCRYVKSFAYQVGYDTGKPLFDGYLAAGCGADLAPMNAYDKGGEFFAERGIPKASIMGAKEPYININTESENKATYWHGDFDDPDFKFRAYEIPGSSHDSKYNLLDYYEGKGYEDCQRIGIDLSYEGEYGQPMCNPHELVFNAAFRNLYAWVRDGVPAPHAPKIDTVFTDASEADHFGAWVRNKTDIWGNATGGIRTPGLDYPLGVYTSSSPKKDGTHQVMFGQLRPFSPDKLIELYGDIDRYRKLIQSSAETLVSSGFLLKDDLENMIELNVKLAEEFGLK